MLRGAASVTYQGGSRADCKSGQQSEMVTALLPILFNLQSVLLRPGLHYPLSRPIQIACELPSIEPVLQKIGTLIKGRDGTRDWMHRGHKRGWVIHWEDAPDATRAAIEAIYLLTTTFT